MYVKETQKTMLEQVALGALPVGQQQLPAARLEVLQALHCVMTGKQYTSKCLRCDQARQSVRQLTRSRHADAHAETTRSCGSEVGAGGGGTMDHAGDALGRTRREQRQRGPPLRH
eukprot:TRINITY_DN6160_c0_g1_i1.p4 TRINITY_DN6160_c0_g1~~TRINITY_DN6160_c0_g1_i1.p4  ORF type:complete len:115 (+),score=3.38 TRINITY_DN6160_c0_g1_i1:345-689(+)